MESLPAFSPERHSAAEVASALGLQPLDQEGGWFRRTAQSSLTLPGAALPSEFGGDRRAYSVIYALFTPDGFSALHRLRGDEIWAFHAGDPLESLRLPSTGHGGWVRLGPGPGGRLHDVIPGGVWQGTRLVAGGRWALVSCVVVPEFVWTDFELGLADPLAARYPAHAAAIRELTRAEPPSGVR